MTTILELIDTAPAAGDGLAVSWTHDDGQWRGVFQLADPLAGSSVEWFDLSEYLLGYNLTRGATTFGGRPEACVANIEVMADGGILAPTNPDTSGLFGDHIDLGAGLLVRFSLIRVLGGAVVEWLPRFTLKVEHWGNASYARGQIRRHLIVARDTLTSLVDVPVPSVAEQDWSDKVVHITTGAEWQYGILAFHDFDLLLPERDEQSSAVRELDAALDPAGLVWFTDRYGHLYIRPRPGDTLHDGAGYTPPTISFHYQASPSSTGLIAYAVDFDIEPFGLAKSELGVKNRFVITSPGGVFDQDDATSVQRFDPKPYRATWLAENDQAAADLLAYRAFAEMEATPLYTCIGQPGFHDLLLADYLHPAGIEHTASTAEEVTSAAGVVRRLEESAVFAGPILDMAIRTTLDIETYSTIEGLILPVDDLALDALGDTGAEFSWTNPVQAVIPTRTQVRMIGATTIWSNYAYPITALSWGGLTPGAAYQFQVRLQRVVDGVIEATSSIRLVNFVTTDTSSPGTGDDGDVDVPVFPGCDTDWELFEYDASDDQFESVATGTTTTGTVDYSSHVTPGGIYKICAREDCAGVFGPWVCGPAWIEPDDWGTPCITPEAFDDPPFDDVDLIAYVPQLCAPATIREAVSGTEAEKGPAFQIIGHDTDGRPKVWSNEQGVILQGAAGAGLGTLEDDLTLCWRGNIKNQPVGTVVLAAFAGVELRIQPEGAGYKASVEVIEQVGGATTITSGTELPLDTETFLNVTHDTTADDLALYVGSTPDVDAIGTVGLRDVELDGSWQMALPEGSWAADVAVFGRVLDPSEMPGFVPAPTVTINKASGQADPTITAPILFTVVFSEAVSGFATGDVTLSGTAGATTAVVSGSGPTYTVTVSGMTGAGTVIATIGAGVCTSVATGLPNAASTSTDNNVTFAGSPLTILGSKLVAWWDGHDPAATGTPPSPGEVTTWFDKTANAHNLGRQAVGGGGSYVANVINDHGIMRFDGTNDGMFSSAPFIYAQGDCQIWFVAKSDESGLGVIIGESRSDTPNLAYRIYDKEDTDDYVFNLENSAGTTRFANTQDRSSNDWDLVICTDLGAAGGTSNEVVDVDAGTTGAYTRDSVTMTRLTVGYQQTNAQSLFFDGDLADILVLDAPASSGERTALAAYFNAKYAKSWSPA